MSRRSILGGRRRVGLRAALIACLLASCASIEHVVLLRNEQDRFSAAAALENEVTATTFLASGGDYNASAAAHWDGAEALSLPTDAALIVNLHRRYGECAQALGILLRDRRSELSADRLLGAAETLHVLAEWRHAYYGLASGALGLERRADGEPLALTRIAEGATSLAGNQEVLQQLFPRDRVMLTLLPGLARFDLAVLDVVRVGPEVFSDDRVAMGTSWISEMVRSDRECEAAFEDLVGELESSGQRLDHLLEYYFSVRRVALSTAGNVDKFTNLSLESEPPSVLAALEARRVEFKRDVGDSPLGESRKLALIEGL